MILDEATSVLEGKQSEIVQQALDRSMENRTAIVIAHSLRAIKNCDYLFVMNNGIVVEKGTFDELSEIEDSYFNKLKT